MGNSIILKDSDPDSPLTSMMLIHTIKSRNPDIYPIITREYPPKIKIQNEMISDKIINSLKQYAKMFPDISTIE